MKERITLLKSYLKRLGEGESLETVRKDFAEAFRDVDATEIMKAEQEMMAEGTPLEELLQEAKEASRIGKVDAAMLARLREISVHYAKKGDLLYLVLSVRHGISGPSDVMWTVDDEIRDEVPIWMDKGGRTMLVRYRAVRDRAGRYIGTAELVEDMEFAREYFAAKEKRQGR